MRKIAYLALDVHVRHCVLGDMENNGKFRRTKRFVTTEQNITHALKSVSAKNKILVIEEGTLSQCGTRQESCHLSHSSSCLL